MQNGITPRRRRQSSLGRNTAGAKKQRLAINNESNVGRFKSS